MKPKLFMTSIQWGSGMHYFIHKGAPTELSAKIAGEYIFKDVIKKHPEEKRGVRPSVYVWKKIAVFKEE